MTTPTLPQPLFQYVNDDGGLTLDGMELVTRLVRATIELQGSPGSNANGDFVRFQMGSTKVQVCWRIGAASSNPTTWTFPMPFSQAPLVLTSAIATSAARMATVGVVSATTAQFYVWDDAGSAQTSIHNEFAFGYWE